VDLSYRFLFLTVFFHVRALSLLFSLCVCAYYRTVAPSGSTQSVIRFAISLSLSLAAKYPLSLPFHPLSIHHPSVTPQNP
jgi:hypothetical protein